MSPLSPKIAIIILNWNGKRDSADCLESLTQLDYPHADIILVDNGSSDGSIPYLREHFPAIHYVELPHNLGFAGGNNAGIKYALTLGSDLFLLLNNDTVISPDFLTHFVRAFHSHPQVGILGASIYLFDQRDTLDHLGGMWNKKAANVDLIGFREKRLSEGPCIPLDYVCGACMIFTKAVLDAIGFLEENYFLYWEENDYCLQAKKAGFGVMHCPQAKIWHKVSASVVGGKPHANYFWWRGRLLWISRHYTRREKFFLYLRVILPAFYKLYKINALKSLQLSFLKLLRNQASWEKKAAKLQSTKASLAGVRDYFCKQYGPGPSWIYKPPKR